MNEPLSYFVKYKNTLTDILIDDVKFRMDESMSVAINIASKSDVSDFYTQKLTKQREKILSELDKFNSVLVDMKNNADKFVKEQESSYLSKSYQMYEDDEVDSTKYILERSLFQSLIYKDDIKKYLISRILKHSDWKHAGMFIRPEHGTYVDEMTSSDPLYIVDEHINLFSPTKLLWNEQYQSRVRYKIIDESKNKIFKDFPIQQINFIVALNFFNYRPLDVIKTYMAELYDLLKPGGIIIFTYNNCNLTLAVQNFEKSLYSYTPESRLVPLIEMIGFIIVESYNEPISNVSWLEIMKPGNTSSIKGGQCIAKINV